eukprot:4004080-Heterocapsa_arctica.AAC.1
MAPVPCIPETSLMMARAVSPRGSTHSSRYSPLASVGAMDSSSLGMRSMSSNELKHLLRSSTASDGSALNEAGLQALPAGRSLGQSMAVRKAWSESQGRLSTLTFHADASWSGTAIP